jgi:hypothetical protein
VPREAVQDWPRSLGTWSARSAPCAGVRGRTIFWFAESFFVQSNFYTRTNLYKMHSG